MYVCTYACMHVCMYACMYACMYIYIHTYINGAMQDIALPVYALLIVHACNLTKEHLSLSLSLPPFTPPPSLSLSLASKISPSLCVPSQIYSVL